MKLKSSEGECTKIGRFGIKADADRSDDVSAASRRSQLLSRESFRANSSLRERSGNMPIDPRVPPDPSQCVGLSASLDGCFLDCLVRRPAPEYRSGRLVRALPFVAYLFAPIRGFGVAGCTVGPDYRIPEINAAPTRTSLETVDVPSRTVDGRIDAAWWKSFRDSQLSSPVERLAAQNLDLRMAAERVV
jgi:hypothetical protein